MVFVLPRTTHDFVATETTRHVEHVASYLLNAEVEWPGAVLHNEESFLLVHQALERQPIVKSHSGVVKQGTSKSFRNLFMSALSMSIYQLSIIL